jgi:two-component system NtrC family response regulator
LRRTANVNGTKELTFGADAARALTAYSWPGNVRELENRVKRAAIMSEGKRLTAADLELDDPGRVSASLNLKEAREAAERAVIAQALRRHSGKIAPAASDLGISRPTLYELMEKLDIMRQEQGGNSAMTSAEGD